HVGPPAGLESLVCDVLLYGADRHRAQPIVEGASAFAQTILRTDSSAHLRQRIGAMGKFRGLEQVSLLDQLQPVGNEVMNRALPFAERIAAGNAAPRLLSGALRVVL